MRYLKHLFAPREGVDAIGFKLMYGHPRVHRALLPYLAARRTRVIHLVRENALEQIVSWETSVARGQFRAHDGEHVGDISVRLDVGHVRERIAEHGRAAAHARTTLRRYRLPTLEVTYERLGESPGDELARIAPFLRVEPRVWAPQSSLVRMNTRRIREIIENSDEIERALEGTDTAWMLG